MDGADESLSLDIPYQVQTTVCKAITGFEMLSQKVAKGTIKQEALVSGLLEQLVLMRSALGRVQEASELVKSKLRIEERLKVEAVEAEKKKQGKN